MTIKEIIKDIRENPQNYDIDFYHFYMKKNRNVINFWISNGFKYCGIEGRKLGILNRWRLWRAYRWWCENYFEVKGQDHE